MINRHESRVIFGLNEAARSGYRVNEAKFMSYRRLAFKSRLPKKREKSRRSVKIGSYYVGCDSVVFQNGELYAHPLVVLKIKRMMEKKK